MDLLKYIFILGLCFVASCNSTCLKGKFALQQVIYDFAEPNSRKYISEHIHTEGNPPWLIFNRTHFIPINTDIRYSYKNAAESQNATNTTNIPLPCNPQQHYTAYKAATITLGVITGVFFLIIMYMVYDAKKTSDRIPVYRN